LRPAADREVESFASPLDPAGKTLPGAVLELAKLGVEFAPDRDRHLRGGGWSWGAAVGGVVDQRGVGLVTDG
jgi:hypothetical protein